MLGSYASNPERLRACIARSFPPASAPASASGKTIDHAESYDAYRGRWQARATCHAHGITGWVPPGRSERRLGLWGSRIALNRGGRPVDRFCPQPLAVAALPIARPGLMRQGMKASCSMACPALACAERYSRPCVERHPRSTNTRLDFRDSENRLFRVRAAFE